MSQPRAEQLAAERRTGSTCTDASASRSRYLPVGDKNALTIKVPCTSASAASAAAALNVAGSTTLCCDAMLLLGSAAVTNGNWIRALPTFVVLPVSLAVYRSWRRSSSSMPPFPNTWRVTTQVPGAPFWDKSTVPTCRISTVAGIGAAQAGERGH